MFPVPPPDHFGDDPRPPIPDNTPLAFIRDLIRHLLRDLFGTVVPAVIIAILINLYLAQGTYVHGQSMEPSLHTAQRLMIEKISHRFHLPHRGDIVVINVDASELPLIKRVIGLPGETIQIKDNRVYIDGRALIEPYLDDVYQQDFGPLTVPPGQIFVLGDNRAASNDSRYFGPINADQIIGRAWLSYWPVQDIHLMK